MIDPLLDADYLQAQYERLPGRRTSSYNLGTGSRFGLVCLPGDGCLDESALDPGASARRPRRSQPPPLGRGLSRDARGSPIGPHCGARHHGAWLPGRRTAMRETGKIRAEHLRRQAYLYVRQSSIRQVQENRESTARQYDLKRRAQALGWDPDQIVVIDEDLGLSGASAANRNGFQRLVAEVGLGRVGLVLGLEVSRLARSSTTGTACWRSVPWPTRSYSTKTASTTPRTSTTAYYWA